MKFESCADSPFSIRAMVRFDNPASVATCDCVNPRETRRRARRSPTSARTVVSVSVFWIFIRSHFWQLIAYLDQNETLLTIHRSEYVKLDYLIYILSINCQYRHLFTPLKPGHDPLFYEVVSRDPEILGHRRLAAGSAAQGAAGIHSAEINFVCGALALGSWHRDGFPS
jgi:hypothetical protein